MEAADVAVAAVPASSAGYSSSTDEPELDDTAFAEARSVDA